MILRCSHCRSKFQVDDALRGKTFRCRVCSSPIKADGSMEENRPAQQQPRSVSQRSAAPAPVSRRAEAPASQSAAVVRRSSDERSKRDLFGQEVQLAAKVVEHENASPFTAARNENSVLFSLDQLAKPRLPETAHAAAASVEPARTKQDSGLIDLNALMADKPLDAKSIRPAPLSEPPLGAFTREVESVPSSNEVMVVPAFKSKHKSKFIAAAAAAGVALFVAVGLVAANREDARVEAAAKAAAQPPPAAAPTVSEPAPTAAPVAQATPPAETKESAEPRSKFSRKSAGPSRGGKTKHASSAAAAPAAPKKAPDPCGCKGDLLCSMKCSAK
jgi:hypothetical protein